MAKKRYTDLGTLCAGGWDRDWVARVNELEAQLGRRVCGARCLDGSSCPRVSKHESGRCAHHGGHHLTGAPDGNLNARLHGLYAMRLQVCGPHCARWESCPFAEADILELPKTQRPNCVFEQEEYVALTEASASDPDEQPETVALRHTTALLQVMVGRAAAALAVQPLTEVTRASTEQYSMESTKTSAALEAFLRLAREHRRYVRELSRVAPPPPPEEPKEICYPDMMKPILKEADGILEDCLEPGPWRREEECDGECEEGCEKKRRKAEEAADAARIAAIELGRASAPPPSPFPPLSSPIPPPSPPLPRKPESSTLPESPET